MPLFENTLSGGGTGGVRVDPRVKRFVVGIVTEGRELDFHKPVDVKLEGGGDL
jgi:hypothetical protein